MRCHVNSFSALGESFAISSHSAANLRNRSDGFIGRPPCFIGRMIEQNAEPLEPFQVELNKFSASVFKFRYRKKPTAPDYALEVCNGFIS